ncbi:MAG: phosphoglucosamine mutase [Candidatus Anstonellaceae archaeon]
MSLFGTNGVRGTINQLGPQLAFELAAAFASWCKRGPILLSRDMRLTSPMLHCAAAAGIMAAGKEALDLGLCSSPVSEYALHHEKAGGLIIVTASHNPPEWNALKFIDSRGVAVSKERGQEIENLLGKNKLAEWNKVGKIKEYPFALQTHIQQILKQVDVEKIRKRKLRLVLDFGNGTAALSSRLFELLGCEIITLNDKLDGHFPGRPSEPSQQNVSQMLAAVKKVSADLGVAWDGDADRVIFADEKGNWIVGDKSFALCAAFACRKAKEKEKLVVTTVATSKVVEEVCGNLGAKTVYTKVGAPYLSQKVLELGSAAVSAGEEVGGIIWPSFSLAKDGILSAAKICELILEQPLSQHIAQLPTYFNSKSKIEVEPEKKQLALDAAKAHAQKSKAKLVLVDGVRADFEDSWVIVRASGTENVVRVFAESKTQKHADELNKEYCEVIQQALN